MGTKCELTGLIQITRRKDGTCAIYLRITRKSGAVDIVEVNAGKAIVKKNITSGDRAKIIGELECRKRESIGMGEPETQLYIAAESIETYEKEWPWKEDINTIEVWGKIKRNPWYRTTPKGKEITELILETGKYGTIPCICWGKIAIVAAGYCEGDEVRIKGRIQSRVYIKKMENGTEKEIITNEVSVFGIQKRV